MIKIGLLGLGTVGAGVYEIINTKGEMIEKSTNIKVEISKVLVQNLNKDRNISIDKNILTDNPYDILEDPEIDMVVEVMGGIDKAYKYIKMALQNGKHVVTANKAVLSEYLYELNSIAKENNKALLYEASVAGGIPIIKALNEMLDLNEITKIKGILNGTTNFILSKMTEDEIDFKEALKLAQDLGYAEADPTDDVEGYDAARKISILSSIAFNYIVNFSHIECRGITSISAFDIGFLKRLGYVVKLVGSACVLDSRLNAVVEPTIIDKNSVMANVANANNMVLLNGDIVGELQFHGQGAGEKPTANAVVSDIIDILNDKYKYVSFENENKQIDLIKETSNYYFRVNLKSREESINILDSIKKYCIKYDVLQKDKELVLILQETNSDSIKKLITELDIVNITCYIKVDSSDAKIIYNLNIENSSEIAI